MDETTYNVRIYKTKVYRGKKVTTITSAGKPRSGTAKAIPERRPSRQFPERAAHRGPQG